MIRSRHHNITAVDKALYLWCLCTVNWMHENNEIISNNNLDKLFGHYNKRRFNMYREIAIDAKDLDPGGLYLTRKGLAIVRDHKRLERIIYTL